MNPQTSTPIFSIELINGEQSLRELYFMDGRRSVFTYKPTRSLLQGTISFIVLSGITYLVSFSDKVAWIVLFYLCVFVAFVFAVLFCISANRYFQWKRSVDAYLLALSKYDKQYLHLNAHSFELVNKDETVIERWGSITKVTFYDTHILLNCGIEGKYTFPAGAMDASTFERLKEFIRQRMKNPGIIEEGKPWRKEVDFIAELVFRAAEEGDERLRPDPRRQTLLSLADAKVHPYALSIADLNGDGRMDIIVGHIGAPSTIWFNEGAGRKFKPVNFGNSFGDVYGFAIGDFNEDGIPDIAVARSEGTNVLYFGRVGSKKGN